MSNKVVITYKDKDGKERPLWLSFDEWKREMEWRRELGGDYSTLY